MSTAIDSSEFANFIRMYKTFRNQRLEGNPYPLTGSQHPTNHVQHPAQRLSPPRSRPQPQPYQQPPLQNPADVSILLQALDDMKKRQDEIYSTLNSLYTTAEDIKKYCSCLHSKKKFSLKILSRTVHESVATMVGTIERFETIGRGVLELAVQSSNSQPSNGASSQPQASNPPQISQHAPQPSIFSNPQRPYQGPNATQPPASFIASANPTHPIYAPPVSQPTESYSEPYVDYSGFEYLATDAS